MKRDFQIRVTDGYGYLVECLRFESLSEAQDYYDDLNLSEFTQLYHLELLEVLRQDTVEA